MATFEIRLKQLFSWTTLFLVSILPIKIVWERLLGPVVSQGQIDNITSLIGGMIVVVAIFSIAIMVRERVVLTVSDKLITVFFFLAIISQVWAAEFAPGFLIGVRYSLFAVLSYFIGRAQILRIDKLDEILKYLLVFTVIFAGTQYIIWALGYGDFLLRIGFGIEHFAGSWPRISGPFPGPNQLATFLAISTLWLFWRKKLPEYLLIASSAVILLTFSRSAILGFFAGYIIPLIITRLENGSWKKTLIVTVVSVLAVALSITLIRPLRSSFIDMRHTDERVSALEDAYNRFSSSSFTELSFGHGAGSSGPASVYSDKPFVPENWFIQIGYEYGLIGLLILVSFWASIGAASYKRKELWLLGIILMVGVNSFFLHPLSDNTPAAIWFYLLLGVGLTKLRREEHV